MFDFSNKSNNLKKKFDKIFKIKNLKKMKIFFNIRIIRNRKNRLFRIN